MTKGVVRNDKGECGLVGMTKGGGMGDDVLKWLKRWLKRVEFVVSGSIFMVKRPEFL